MISLDAPIEIDGIKCFSPTVAELYDDYPDSGFDLTARMAERSFWVRSRNRIFKRLVLANCSSGATIRFLEIGCGTGDFIRTIADQKDLAITGSEVYVKGLHYAKACVPDVEFVQLDIEHDKIDAAFEIVAAFDVIEHIEDDAAAIDNMTRMLSDEGTLIISVPQYQFLWGQIDEIVKHKRRYSKAELVEKLRRNNLQIRLCTSFVFMLFPLMLISRLLDRSHAGADETARALEKRTAFPVFLNWVFEQVMRIDETLIDWGVSLPFGGTLIAVAKKSGPSERPL